MVSIRNMFTRLPQNRVPPTPAAQLATEYVSPEPGSESSAVSVASSVLDAWFSGTLTLTAARIGASLEYVTFTVKAASTARLPPSV